MYKYAQIDETGRCISVSFLSGEVESENMLPLTDEDDVQPDDVWDGTAWTRPIPPAPEPPGPSRIDVLESENADLKSRLKDIELALADLFTGGGV